MVHPDTNGSSSSVEGVDSSALEHGWSLVQSRASGPGAGGGTLLLSSELLDGFARLAPFLPAAEVAHMTAFFRRWKASAEELGAQRRLEQSVILVAVALVRNMERGHGIDSAVSRLHASLLELREHLEQAGD